MTPQGAMLSVPLKLSILVQFVIFISIVASTVTITRSVVQNSLTRIHANLERFHRGGGPECAATPAATDGGGGTEVLNYTELHGFIVSNRERRYNNSREVLGKLGIRAHHYVPLSYKSEEIHNAMTVYHAGSTKYHTDTYKKVFSNRMAFTDLFQKFVDDGRANINSWRFFFEDDLQLHPGLTEPVAQRAVARGMEVASGDGIMYLGICGPRSCQDKTTLFGSLEASRCSGACTHAFALTKWKTAGFLSYMDKLKTPNDENITSMYFDQLMRSYGSQVHKIWVLGSNLKSPQVSNHYGLVFQDRSKFPSVINTREPKQ